MIFRAYCVTSVVLDNQIVTPIADNTVNIAIPNGNSAATKVPNTISRISTVSGPETSSAVIKSS